MVGISYATAGVDIRQLFALSEEKLGDFLESVKNEPSVSGCVVISTCNRTEMYLSLNRDIDIKSMFCSKFGFDVEKYSSYLTDYSENDALDHLMMLSSGLMSQLRGDDQILSQVKQSLAKAREIGSTDSVLEVIFRNAISCGKQIKTELEILSVNTSVSFAALKAATEVFGNILGKKVLVIGNGKIGRLTAELFIKNGADVTVTLRSYKRGVTVIPKGARTVPYDERYLALQNTDLLISATASPHFTVTKNHMGRLNNMPKVAMDLAVPRDIEPSVSDLGIKIFDIDTFDGTGTQLDEKSMLHIDGVVKKYKKKFYDWLDFASKIS